MKVLFRDANVYENGVMKKQTMLFDGVTLSVSPDVCAIDEVFVFDDAVILPGFCDVHVHFREPGSLTTS